MLSGIYVYLVIIIWEFFFTIFKLWASIGIKTEKEEENRELLESI